MGNCVYCGKPAGFLHTQHKECRELHDVAASKIPAFFVESLKREISPERFQDLAQQIASSHYIDKAEFRQLVINGLKAMVDTAFATGDLAESDNSRIVSFCNQFGVVANDLGPEGLKLTKLQILRTLDQHKVPSNVRVGDLPIVLERGESVLWLFNDVTYLTTKTQTSYVGASQGISIRLMKGLYYRAGAFKGQPVKTQYLSEEGRGVFVVTNENIYFWSPLRALKFPFKKIISAYAFSDAIQIMREGANTTSQIFKLDDPFFAADLVARASQL